MSSKIVRLSNDELFTLTAEEELIEFYRQYPEIACEDLLGIKLVWFQRIILREMWSKRSTLTIMTRGLSKSFMDIIASLLFALLYPEMQIGLISRSYRQVRLFMFTQIKQMVKNSQYLKNSVEGKIITGQEACRVGFKNGSYVEGLPPGSSGETIRGQRYHISFVDEYAFMDPDLVNTVIMPMLSVKKMGRSNKIHFSTTPYFKWTHIWPTYLRQIKMAIENSNEYSLLEFDHRDLNETPLTREMPELPFEIEDDFINMMKQRLTKEQFQMEIMARFPDESNSFFSSKLIDSASRKKPPLKIELKGVKNTTYVMGVDVARLVDDFAIAIGKREDDVVKLVLVDSLHEATYQQMHKMIRYYLRMFEISDIAIGAGGGGLTIKDLLAEEWFDPITKETYSRILDDEDEKHMLLKGLRIVRMIKESNQLNSFMYSTLKSDMENGRFYMPTPLIYLDEELNIKEQKIMKEIITTQNEFLKLEAVPTSFGYRFEVPDQRKDRKDRATAVVLMNYIFSEKRKEIEKPHKEVPVGFWITV